MLNQSELPIIHGGGRDFLLAELKPEQSNIAEVLLTELFILNTCVILWFNDWERSLQIPYQNIMYHAIRKAEGGKCSITEGHALELILTVERDPIIDQLFPLNSRFSPSAQEQLSSQDTMASVELILKPKYANYDRHYNHEPDDLFTFKEFGLNRGDSMVRNCHKAIATCMDFHASSLSDSEEQSEKQNSIHNNTAQYSGIADLTSTQNVYHNSGLADDLDLDATMDVYAQNGSEAGMSLQFYADQKAAGVKKPHFGDEPPTLMKRARN